MSEERHYEHLTADAPIDSSAEDELGRHTFAKIVANEIALAPAPRGFVIGITGPWGVGKTSMLHLVENELMDGQQPPLIIRFNPWLVSGSEQLLRQFISELSTQVSENPRAPSDLKSIGETLLRYGEAIRPLSIVPVVGSWAARMAAAASVLRAARPKSEQREKSVLALRKELDSLLSKTKHRLVVMVDDVDRLLPHEIQEVLRTVRTIADFPNTVYVLAYDRRRIEEALEGENPEHREDVGRGYLEKIVQISHEVPPPRDADLRRIITSSLDLALTEVEIRPSDADYWTNVFHTIVQPLIRTIRDAKRYANSVGIAARLLGREVSRVDIMAMEAVRIFLPDVFSLLPAATEALTEPAPPMGHSNSSKEKRLQQQVEELLAAAGDHRLVMEEVCKRVFPLSHRHIGGAQYGPDFMGRWRKERRVAVKDVLQLYIEQRLPDDAVETQEIEAVTAMLEDPERLSSLLNGLSKERLVRVLERLEDYEEDLTTEAVEAALPVLLSFYPQLSDESEGMTGFSPRFQLSRLVYRFLRSIETQEQRSRLVDVSLGTGCTLSARLDLVKTVGYEENAGHKLVSEEAAERFEERLLEELMACRSADLQREPEILRLVWWAYRYSEDQVKQWAHRLFQDEQLLLHALGQTLSYTKTQTAGSGLIKKEPRLPWERLERVFGKDFLAERVTALQDSGQEEPDARTASALDLAVHYAAGWRPSDW